MATTTGPLPEEAETTGGTTCRDGAGQFGVGRSATDASEVMPPVALGTALVEALGTALVEALGTALVEALGTVLGTALRAPDPQAVVATATRVIIKKRTRR